jgi:MarR family transcriptional regulator, 2-MHQ and catechol-resistance regulon repressor
MARISLSDDRLITTFGRLVEAHSALSRQLGKDLEDRSGISHSTFEVLLRISRAEGGQISMSALAQQVALTSGGITRLLDRLIDVGLVQRVPCPTDRRVSFAALTDAGTSVLNGAKTLHAANLRELFSELGPEEMAQLDELLDRLRRARLGGGQPRAGT